MRASHLYKIFIRILPTVLYVVNINVIINNFKNDSVTFNAQPVTKLSIHLIPGGM